MKKERMMDMAVIRVEKVSDYTVVNNHYLRDKSLSMKAKGLLSVILSLPDDWDYTVNGLVNYIGEGKTAVTNALKELENNGYMVRRRIRDDCGRLGNAEWVIYEKPMTENIAQENIAQENQPQLNTNIPNTKKQNTENIYNPKEVRHRHGPYWNVMLTDAQYETLQEEFPLDYDERIERLSEYIESTGKKYKNHLAVIRTWARKDGVKPATATNKDNEEAEAFFEGLEE